MATGPDGPALLRFLGDEVDPDAEPSQADHVVRAVTLLVRAYTRGRGFAAGTTTATVNGTPVTVHSMEADLAAVIVSAAARLYSNPELTVRVEAGSHSEVPGTFRGWTLPELAVLHRYRRRAA
ncbi:MAG: hypothetical protein M3P46_10755 [Actinomycetota bacterium]|nr:hypothetical protein [Actinomycetota bacterium]